MIESRGFRWSCLAFIVVCVVVRAFYGVYDFWNDVRFSRAYALAHGYDLYTPADSGVISGIIYGPVGYLLYAPAALWATPLPALVSASLITSLATLGPAALVLADRRVSGESRTWVVPLITLVVLHFYESAAMAGAWIIHTDAAALGFACLAIYWILLHPLDRTLSWPLVAAAMAAALAVWAKQTVAPILLIPCGYLLLKQARHSAFWVSLLSAGLAALLGVVFAVRYGFSDLWLAMFAVPANHPLYPGLVLRDVERVTDFMEMVCLLAVLVVCAILRQKQPESAEQTGIRRISALFPDRTAWPLICGTGLVLLPMSFLGRMKHGGFVNNFGLAEYFLTLGIALMFARLAGHPEFRQAKIRRALRMGILLVLAVMVLRTAADLANKLHRIAKGPLPSVQAAYEYAQEHPGETYFPWHPLASLMAEGRLHHTAWGVMERELAGFPVGDAHFRAHLPPRLERIAAIDNLEMVLAINSVDGNHDVFRRLPEFRCKVQVAALPQWSVVGRGSENCGVTQAFRTQRVPLTTRP